MNSAALIIETSLLLSCAVHWRHVDYPWEISGVILTRSTFMYRPGRRVTPAADRHHDIKLSSLTLQIFKSILSSQMQSTFQDTKSLLPSHFPPKFQCWRWDIFRVLGKVLVKNVSWLFLITTNSFSLDIFECLHAFLSFPGPRDRVTASTRSNNVVLAWDVNSSIFRG